MNILNILISLTLLSNLNLFAEDSTKSIYWFQAGTGITFSKFSDSDVGLNFLFSVNYENSNNSVNLSFMHSNELGMSNHPQEYLKSYVLKYGRSHDFSMKGLLFPTPLLLLINKEFEYSIIGRIGISYNKGLKRTNLLTSDFLENNYNSEITKGFGIPFEVEIREKITNYMGMSVLFFSNFNTVKNYWGFSFSIQAGVF